MWGKDMKRVIDTEEQAYLDALEHALFLINQEESNPSFNWDDAPVICELNGYRWYLGQEADEEMNWHEAVEWCKSVGGELPPRDILLQCFLNEDIRPLFKPEWYWNSTEFNAAVACKPYFYDDYQSNTYKNNDVYVRAVKRVKL